MRDDIDIMGTYETSEDYMCLDFTTNWDLFYEQAQMTLGDLFVIKVQIKPEYIKLTFEKVSDDVEQPMDEDEEFSEDEAHPQIKQEVKEEIKQEVEH